MICWHKWTKWEDITIKNILTDNFFYVTSGQKRYCTKCNKKQVRDVDKDLEL